METYIRRATIEEASTIAKFQQMMAMETEELALDKEIISSGVKAVFDDPSKGQYFVATNNMQIQGSFLITYEWSDWRNSYIWWFQSVYVMPEYRRLGIFRKMYDFAKNAALDQGVAGLRLYVEVDNKRAQKTYGAMGMSGDHYTLFEWLK